MIGVTRNDVIECEISHHPHQMTTAADAALSDAVLTVFITSTAVLVHHSKEMSPQIAQSGVARIIFHRDLGSNCLTRRLLKN